METIAKSEAKYFFSNTYTDHTEKEQVACVTLILHYQTKSFDIIPHTGITSTNDSFKFIHTSHKYKMWRAVLKSIDQAIGFATQELYLEKSQKPDKGTPFDEELQ